MSEDERRMENDTRGKSSGCCGSQVDSETDAIAQQDSEPCGCGSAPSKKQKSSSGCDCGGRDDRDARDAQEDSAIGDPTMIRPTDSKMTWRNWLDHLLARWGFDREGHRVQPGLYALGRPTPESPVLVSANYTLSFDSVRTSQQGRDAYILVLNTFGINVWCAAGKGTFGTDEVIRKIRSVRLEEVVRHRRIILPQLGAPGVDAAAVRAATGFRADFGPVRAEDLPAYLDKGKATPAMRRVRFSLRDRIVLIPVELMVVLVPVLVLALLRLPDFLTAVLAGVILFPILLPWLPTANYSTKGFLLGALAAAPFAAGSLSPMLASAGWQSIGMASAQMLALPPITAFLALNFTGSTPYPSRTGVRREIHRYVQPMAVFFAFGVVLYIGFFLLRLLKG
jgi:hypothetical protein